jgi:hypothetical protein
VTALSAQNVELKGALAEADAARTLLAAQVPTHVQIAALDSQPASALVANNSSSLHDLQP